MLKNHYLRSELEQKICSQILNKIKTSLNLMNTTAEQTELQSFVKKLSSNVRELLTSKSKKFSSATTSWLNHSPLCGRPEKH